MVEFTKLTHPFNSLLIMLFFKVKINITLFGKMFGICSRLISVLLSHFPMREENDECFRTEILGWKLVLNVQY